MKGQKGKALVFTVALENSQTLYYNRNMKKVNRYLITIFLCLVAFVLAGLFLLGCETTPDDNGNVNNEVFNVLYTTDGNGTVQGEAEQTVPYGDSATTVTAVPNAGYRFVKWSDTDSDNPVRTDENVTDNLTATAEFEFLYGGGSGSLSNPYLIENYAQLKNMLYCPDAYFRLVNDLDLEGISHEPICKNPKQFSVAVRFYRQRQRIGFQFGQRKHRSL